MSEFNTVTKPGFKAHKGGTNQTGIVSNTFTKITFSTEVYDVGGFFDNVTNFRWTPPAGPVLLMGRTDISGTVTAGAGAGGGLTLVSMFKNGGELQRCGGPYSTSTLNNSGLVVVTDVANGTDFYEIWAYCGLTGTGVATGAVAETFFSGQCL